MLFRVVDMLKKRLGVEAIEIHWWFRSLPSYFKIPSSLIISDGCRRVGDYALGDCKNLKKVVFPESLEEIGIGSFVGTNIEEVRFFGSKISKYAFRGCTKLKRVILSNKTKEIEGWVFLECYEARITINKPENDPPYIGTEAFKGCKEVKYV